MISLIMFDIINNVILDESYFERNDMRHIFSKRSLELAINAAGGELKYLNTNCVKDPGKAFDDLRLDIDCPSVIFSFAVSSSFLQCKAARRT